MAEAIEHIARSTPGQSVSVTDELSTGLPGQLTPSAFGYWASKRSDDQIPARSLLLPEEMVSFLPNINLVDVIRDGDKNRFRHRIIGSEVQSYMPTSSVGQWFEDIYTPEHLAPQARLYDQVIQSRQPSLTLMKVALRIDFTLEYWRLILPCGEDGRNVDTLMLVLDFLNFDRDTGNALPISYPVADSVMKQGDPE